MRILVPVDGSSNSLEGVRVAAGLARDRKAELHLLHVVPALGGVDLEITPRRREGLLAEQRRRGEKALAAAAEALRPSGVQPGRSLVEAPSAAEGIIEAAGGGGFDLVVIGSRGHTGVTRFMLGSTASKVVRHSPCSVYVVKTAD